MKLLRQSHLSLSLSLETEALGVQKREEGMESELGTLGTCTDEQRIGCFSKFRNPLGGVGAGQGNRNLSYGAGLLLLPMSSSLNWFNNPFLPFLSVLLTFVFISLKKKQNRHSLKFHFIL